MRGWYKSRPMCNLREVYSNRLYSAVACGDARRERILSLLQQHSDELPVEAAFAILRDHGLQGGDVDPTRGVLWGADVCMHASMSLFRPCQVLLLLLLFP